MACTSSISLGRDPLSLGSSRELSKPFTANRPGIKSAVSCRAARQVAKSSQFAAPHRRAILLAGLVAGLSASQAANAVESTCSNFTTATDGIRWCDTQEGTGNAPAKGQLIRCHYTGRLTSNGRVFDSSYERRRPLSFKVGAREVIQGWDKSILGDEDLPPMKEGGKRRVIIPPELAYGSRGAGGVIPPDATLTFDIELLGKR